MNDPQVLQQVLDDVASAFVKQMGMQVVQCSPSETRLMLPVTDALVHAGGVLCGQAILAAADTAMLLALVAHLGGFRPMTTVQLQTSFLRPVPRATLELSVTGRVLRSGKSLSFGEVSISTPDGKLAAHATSTYALL